MAQALKHHLSQACVEHCAHTLKVNHPTFDRTLFTKLALRGIVDQELTERVTTIRRALTATLPSSPDALLSLLRRVAASAPQSPSDSDEHTSLDSRVEDLNPTSCSDSCTSPGTPLELGWTSSTSQPTPPLDSSGTLSGWIIWPLSLSIVDLLGATHPDKALEGLASVTGAFTSEFAMRELLLVSTFSSMHAQVLALHTHPDPHVRRLSCEGLRPRLPWGKKVAPLCQPESIDKHTQMLLALSIDESLYVRRSAANHLADVAKIDSAWFVNFITAHPPQTVGSNALSPTQATARKWVYQHAARYLIKHGHTPTLAAFGYHQLPFTPTFCLTDSPTPSKPVDVKRASKDVKISHRIPTSRTTPLNFPTQSTLWAHVSLPILTAQPNQKDTTRTEVIFDIHLLVPGAKPGTTKTKVFKGKKVVLKTHTDGSERQAQIVSFALRCTDSTVFTFPRGNYTARLLANGTASFEVGFIFT